MFFLFNNLKAYKPNHREKLEKLEKHQLARLCTVVAFVMNWEKPGLAGGDDVGFSRFVTKGGGPQTRMKPCYSSYSSFSTHLRARMFACSGRQSRVFAVLRALVNPVTRPDLAVDQ